MTNILDFNNALRERELEAYLKSGVADDSRADRIRDGLNACAESFIAWMFPAAVFDRRCAKIGNTHGDPGFSLTIETKGSKVGVWKDFGNPDQKGGDLIGLYMAAKGVSFPKALEDLADWIGQGTRPEVNYERQRLAAKAKRVERDLGAPKGEWHYTDADNNIIASVYRFEPAEGGKEFLPWDAVKGAWGNPPVRPLYNIPGILRSRTVVICEGEKAAKALNDRGITATAVMGGCNSPLERTDLEPLRDREVVIWPDADEPGWKFATGFALALQDIAGSVRIIELPDGVTKGWDAADAVAEGKDIAALVELGRVPTSEQLSPLPLEWAGSAEPVLDGFWLIDDWLPSSGIAAIYGHPGCGKSFFALNMAAHVAAGKPWAGRHVERGLVLYVVAEGATGFRNRMYAMREAGEIAPDAPLAFVATPIDMQAENGDVKALIETIRIAAEACGLRPALIVLDTLSKTFGAGKENTDDMVSYVNNCQKVASAFTCLTVIVHHRPKDQDSKDLRGHSSLRGNIDTAILVEKGDIKTATTLKQKDGEDNIQVRFRLRKVSVGHDRRGKEITTCLVQITDEEPGEQDMNGLSGKEQQAIMILSSLLEKARFDPDTGEIFDVPVMVLADDWRAALGTTGTLSRDNPETARKQFNRLRKGLIDKGKITVDGNLVGVSGT